MKYEKLCEFYDKLDSTSKRLEKTYHVAKLLAQTMDNEIERMLLLLQGRVFPPWDETNIGVALRTLIKAINVATGIDAAEIEGNFKVTGDLGKTASDLISGKKQHTLFSEDLTVAKVFSNIRKIASMEGQGSVSAKVRLMAELLSSAKPIEAKYVSRTLLEDLRIGIGEGIIRDAIVWSTLPWVGHLFVKCSCGEWNPKVEKCLECGTKLDKPKKVKGSIETTHDEITKISSGYEQIWADDEKTAREIYNRMVSLVDDAYSVANEFYPVVKKLREKGLEGLQEIELAPGKPVKVMLYQKAKDMKDAFERVGKPCAVEYKYDGFRMQIHKHPGIKSKKNIRIYTRRLENVTAQFADVVDYVDQNVKAESFIIDAEAVGYDKKTTQYLPFQKISQRIKRKHDIKKMSTDFPVELNVFDILYHDGKSQIKEPFSQRRKLLSEIIEPEDQKIVLSRITVTSDIEEANSFYQESLDRGNEGVMAKKLDAEYKPGSRVGYGVKVKPVMESLDLVIVGAEWGTGKRATWLTSFTLACIDDEGQFLEVGKVGTGIKELEGEGVTFAQMTELLRPLIISESGTSVKTKPKMVIEINYEEIQKSPNYSSGYALRFPRLMRLREDRSAEEASSLDMVEELYESQ